MKGTISIDKERCKACDYCVNACPLKIIGHSKLFNSQGFAPAILIDNEGKCTGCGLCFVVCPDAAIEIFRTIKQKKKGG